MTWTPRIVKIRDLMYESVASLTAIGGCSGEITGISLSPMPFLPFEIGLGLWQHSHIGNISLFAVLSRLLFYSIHPTKANPQGKCGKVATFAIAWQWWMMASALISG
ncbi:MAG: hypothetical protein ILM98_09940 [Kiritimatiellae bacterium]|nr:hypothetical protein [Kiritimatiellia bacterium]